MQVKPNLLNLSRIQGPVEPSSAVLSFLKVTTWLAHVAVAWILLNIPLFTRL